MTSGANRIASATCLLIASLSIPACLYSISVAFSSLGRELVPVNNEAGYFYKQLPIFSETSDLIVTQDRGKSVARCLGQHRALILRNHGIVAAGRSIEEAVWIAVKLERACRVQLMAEWAGGPKFVAEGEDLQEKNKRGSRPDLYTNVFNYLVRSWCRIHGKANDPCCAEHYETDLSGIRNSVPVDPCADATLVMPAVAAKLRSA